MANLDQRLRVLPPRRRLLDSREAPHAHGLPTIFVIVLLCGRIVGGSGPYEAFAVGLACVGPNSHLKVVICLAQMSDRAGCLQSPKTMSERYCSQMPVRRQQSSLF